MDRSSNTLKGALVWLMPGKKPGKIYRLWRFVPALRGRTEFGKIEKSLHCQRFGLRLGIGTAFA
jgi:hypothetical protein